MIDLGKIHNIDDLENDELIDVLEAMAKGNVARFSAVTLRKVLQSSFQRDNPDVLWNALELAALRSDIEITDLLLNLVYREQDSSVSIFLIEQLLERSDCLDNEVFLQFLLPEKGDLVRETAARALLILGDIHSIERVESIFQNETRKFVKLNLAAVLFVNLKNEDYLSFIKKYLNSMDFALSKEARECMGLLNEHLY